MYYYWSGVVKEEVAIKNCTKGSLCIILLFLGGEVRYKETWPLVQPVVF